MLAEATLCNTESTVAVSTVVYGDVVQRDVAVTVKDVTRLRGPRST